MSWWIEKKEILVREQYRIKKEFPENDFKFEIRDEHLWLTGSIDDFFFECKYPSSYPFAPPIVYPIDRSAKHVPKHQYTSSKFCLDIREISWNSTLSVTDMILSLKNLLLAERKRVEKDVENIDLYEEPEPTFIDKILNDNTWILPSDIAFPVDKDFGIFHYTYLLKSSQVRFIIVGYKKEEDDKVVSELAESIWTNDIFKTKWNGLWIRIKIDDLKILSLKKTTEIEKFLHKEYFNNEEFNLSNELKNESFWKILIIIGDLPYLSLILNCDIKKDSVSVKGIYYFKLSDLEKRIPNKNDYNKLKEKKVTVIGCGSGGSRVSEYLVKSGIEKIVLIDSDFLTTENILRHSCQLDSIGFEKVYALADFLKKINPNVKITTLKKKLDIIDPNTDEKIKDSNLIVVETAENELMFNEYCYTRNIPAIYTRVYPEGFGAETIRVVPGITPCYECSHFFKENLIKENFPNSQFPDFDYQSYDTTSTGEIKSIPALAVDSDFISLIVVKMILEVLLTDDLSELKDKNHIKLWGNKKEWIFDNENQLYTLPNRKKCFKNCIVLNGKSIICEEINKSNEEINNEYNSILKLISNKSSDE